MPAVKKFRLDFDAAAVLLDRSVQVANGEVAVGIVKNGFYGRRDLVHRRGLSYRVARRASERWAAGLLLLNPQPLADDRA